MIRLELEILNDKEQWEIMITNHFNDIQHLRRKIKDLKKIYALHQKDYRIYITLKSKINEKRV
jgi:mRNA-degrading endonuclease RelE of RelBE toxin-antitoxin system